MKQITKNMLPHVRGKYIEGQRLDGLTWLRVGGAADILFMPADSHDLADFLAHCDADIPLYIFGAGSNILVRDDGVRGVVIRLGKAFAALSYDAESGFISAGAAVLDAAMARFALAHERAGLAFFSGIPGAIGGALAMNAGAYGQDTKAVLEAAHGFNRHGEAVSLSAQDMQLSYRSNPMAEGLFFTHAVFKTQAGKATEIEAEMDKIMQSRQDSQPVRARTSGSTFKNPYGASGEPKAWQLIDSVGGRGLRKGDAQFSELHCNFLINHGQADAQSLEDLGLEIQERVRVQKNITLEWEVRRIGDRG